MGLSGWFLVNIITPLLLPVVGILPLQLLPLGSAAANLRLMSTVKDGQLCWAVIAMGAATNYEMWAALEAHRPLPAWSGPALVTFLAVMLTAAVLAAGGAVFSTPLRTVSGSGSSSWVSHYRVFVASAAMTSIAAFIYTAVHLTTTV